ncbi:MAG: hypothetical protein AAF725_06360 [Acidobacteriota bacterium]
MRVVNLSRRPFFNRRPVARAALGMWMLGGLLLVANLWFWGLYFQGSSTSSDRLEALERQVAEEESLIDGQWQRLRDVGLAARNTKASYLNTLIHHRTFPWSRLFDELEDVLPRDVYLLNVQPDINLSVDPQRQVRRRSSRATTAREARRRDRERRSGNASSSADQAADSRRAVAQEPESERERVTLTLRGVARNEEAFFDLVDRLYGHESFLDPDLNSEAGRDGVVEFDIDAVYLTPEREVFPVRIEELPPEEGEQDLAAGQPPAEGDGGGVGLEGSLRGAVTAETAPDPEDDASFAARGRGIERPGPGSARDTLEERRRRVQQRADEVAERQRNGASSRDGSLRPLEDARELGTREPEARERGEETARGRRPSRVSVAPRGVRGGAVVGQPAPQEAGREPAPVGASRSPSVESGSFEPDPTPPATTTPRRPAAGRGSVDRPEPAQPVASGSPRLLGSLEWMPRNAVPPRSRSRGATALDQLFAEHAGLERARGAFSSTREVLDDLPSGLWLGSSADFRRLPVLASVFGGLAPESEQPWALASRPAEALGAERPPSAAARAAASPRDRATFWPRMWPSVREGLAI